MTAATESIASNERTGYSVCTICDIGCQLRTTVKDGRVVRIDAHDSPALRRNICYKGTAAPHIHNHEERLTKPLKRVGERGEDKWEEISYEQAMDEIAERLSGVVEQYGPESLVVSTSGWNTQTTHGMDRRFIPSDGHRWTSVEIQKEVRRSGLLVAQTISSLKTPRPVRGVFLSKSI